MDPIEQILTQGRIGSSGNGPTPQYQAFEEGQKNSLSRQRLALEGRQVKIQEQELPIKLATYLQNQQLNSLKIQNDWQQKQSFIETGKAVSEAYSLVSQKLKDQSVEHPANYNEIRASLSEIFQKYPLAAGTKAINDIYGMIDKSEQFSENARIHRDADNLRLLTAKDQKATEATKNADAAIALEQAKPGALPMEDPYWNTRRSEVFNDLIAKSGDEITMTDAAGNTTSFRRGGSGSNALQNKMAAKEIDASVAIDAGNKLLNTTDSSTVGLKGVASNLAFNIIGPQISDITGNPVWSKYANEKSIDYAVLAREFRAKALRSLIVDNVMTDNERRSLEGALPGVGVKESSLDARRKIHTMMKVLADGQRIVAGKLGKPLANEFKTPEELGDDYLEYEKQHPNASPQELEQVRNNLWQFVKKSPYRKLDIK